MRFWVGLLLCILTLSGCASVPEKPVVEKPFWERILDEIPWEDRITESIVGDELTLPDIILSVLYRYGYQYVNATYQIQRKDGLDTAERIYELERKYASYDPSDDTFLFIGQLYPDESTIWLLFSKNEDYDLYAGPVSQEGEYRHNRVSGKPQL
jgi:hypothetical protein